MGAGVQLYERALALQPKHAHALYCLGVASMEQGLLCRAVYFYEATLQHAPACAEAWNNLGMLQVVSACLQPGGMLAASLVALFYASF